MNDSNQVAVKIEEFIETYAGTSAKSAGSLAGLDSIDLMELSMAIELHFGIEITGAQIAELGDTAELSRFIRSFP